MSECSCADCDNVTMRYLWRHESAKVLQLLYPSISAMTVLDGFLDPATSSQALASLLVFLSSVPTGSCFPAESQENIGGEGCIRGTRVKGHWPQDSTVCRSSQSSSIYAKVRSSV